MRALSCVVFFSSLFNPRKQIQDCKTKLTVRNVGWTQRQRSCTNCFTAVVVCSVAGIGESDWLERLVSEIDWEVELHLQKYRVCSYPAEIPELDQDIPTLSTSLPPTAAAQTCVFSAPVELRYQRRRPAKWSPQAPAKRPNWSLNTGSPCPQMKWIEQFRLMD